MDRKPIPADYRVNLIIVGEHMYKDAKFAEHVKSLRPSLEKLLAMSPVKPTQLPRQMPKAWVYVLSENGQHLYVGRSNDIRRRIRRHSLPYATHRMAAFAFRLAREATGNLRATYKKGEGSRTALIENPVFADAFTNAKTRICGMELQYVEEIDPVRQTLLEVYAAVVLEAKYNDFDNH